MKTELFPSLPVTEPPPLDAARRRLARLESEPPVYLKFDVERTSESEVYIRVSPGTLPKDVPRSVIEEAARDLDDSDWGYRHDYSGYNGRQVDNDEAEAYSVADARGIDAARAEVARLEQEAMR